MADSRSGAGGKIVANRRKQRLATTPYDRPPSQPPPGKSPSWFSGRVLPSARAIASGAGKILASVLYSESSSSEEDEDEDSGADGVDNDEDAYDGDKALHERIETKRIIEQLIMQETFSREECDRLTELLKSRVIDWSMEREKRIAAHPGKMTDNEVGDMYKEAVLEAKKWFREKKMGPSSVENTDEGTCDPNPSGTEHVNSAGGSPLDVARSYMRDRPPWASPTKQIELSTPLTARMELIKEGTSYSVGHDSLSSSKKRNSVTSGSWNIQEELRRVRTKATEDMLRTPSSRIDPSLFAIATSRQEDMEKKAIEPDSFRKTHQIGVLMDAGVSSDPVLAALESRQDGKASEALSTKPANLYSGNNEDSKVGQIDGESFTLKLSRPTSSKSEELHTDSEGPPENKVTEIGGTPEVNGFSLSQTSLSPGGVTSQNHEQDNEDSHNTNKNKSLNAGNLEGRCELSTETCVEVPIVTETASIASGSQNSLSKQREELSEEMIQPSTDGKTDFMHGKPQAKKKGGNLRRSKRRGK
ncbi:protein KAKU4-like isoform X2 [Primulina eburnea]|uniref:protein KAKU4-like isoform X2 n=1 Tax=Primulina eburnea TaxID=1245227 RepID=UPI003C6BD91F